MKLQGQYNRITILSTFFILLIAAVGYYFLLRSVLVRQLDEALKEEEAEISDYIRQNDKLPVPTVYKDQRISFQPTDQPVKRNFSSLSIYDSIDHEREFSRQLLFLVRANGQNYRASVTNSEEATEDLVWIILFSTIALIVLLTAILFFTNRFLVKKMWQPFRDTLASIKEFNLSAPVAISMSSTNITEFRELNESIHMMAQKVLRDYRSLKDFTDHASHEMQTPLAIINSRLDALIQEPEISEKSMQQVQGIYKAVEKLARLCQSLLLLTRIENNQFTERHMIAVNELIKEKRTEMQEWISSMNISVQMELEPLEVNMNMELAEVLVSNLFRNAVRHTEPGSSIRVVTKNNKLSICNTGKAALDKNRIFDRFYKSDQSGGSGLGLAIVKQVCEQYGFAINYEFNNGHCFTILFGEV